MVKERKENQNGKWETIVIPERGGSATGKAVLKLLVARIGNFCNLGRSLSSSAFPPDGSRTDDDIIWATTSGKTPNVHYPIGIVYCFCAVFGRCLPLFWSENGAAGRYGGDTGEDEDRNPIVTKN